MPALLGEVCWLARLRGQLFLCIALFAGAEGYLVVSAKASWFDAALYCMDRGGVLATIATAAQNALIIELLTNASVDHAYLGGNDHAKEGTWVWADGQSMDVTYSDWDSGQPDNWGGNEHCLTMVNVLAKTHGWANQQKWVDYPCMEELPFVCQDTHRPPMSLQNISYPVVASPKLRWFDAAQYCADRGGMLAKIACFSQNL